LKGYSQIFRIYLVAAIPLAFQSIALRREALRKPLYGVRDKLVSFLDGLAGFIYEAGLNPIPSGTKIIGNILWK